jgi:hypothetical protein
MSRPPFAPFERWQGPADAASLLGIEQRHTWDGSNLTPMFRNHGELHAQGPQDGIDGFKAWMCACA